MPSTISFRRSEQHRAHEHRQGRPPQFMAIREFADYVGLPVRLIEAYVNQGLLSTFDTDGEFVEVKVAQRELSAMAKLKKFKNAA